MLLTIHAFLPPPKLDPGPNSVMDRFGSMEPFGARLRVLVVDDNKDAADSLAVLLRLLGYYADVAYDGTNGLALAHSLKSQAFILDISMPNMHGAEAHSLFGEPPATRAEEIAVIARTLAPSLVVSHVACLRLSG
jgi:CheY-like chemotaxis protein